MSFVRWSELDRTTFPEFRDRLLGAVDAGVASPGPRSYPGYPREKLDRPRPRALVGLDRALVRRRSERRFRAALPSRRTLSRILLYAHGIHAGHGVVPSAGGLDALELYVVSLGEGWLPRGAYHYDRAGNHLSRVADGVDRQSVPSVEHVVGGSLLWVIVGDAARGREKYGERGDRFLMLEAGHLMQNLAVLSTSVGCATVPLGGFFEREIAASLRLLETDLVLYVGVAGVVG